jgi:two-component system response regulator HydG
LSISKRAIPLALNLLFTLAVSSREATAARWILVADGDEAAANRVAGFLLRSRFRAYPAPRGIDALRLARRHRLGLAIVDVHLLDMPGRELIRQLRAIEPALPVVMTTGDFRPTTEVEARQLGIVQYIHKPVDLQRLDLVISRIFAADTELAPRVTVPSNGREGG